MNAHPFSLRQLQYAVAVAETGGFRRAAERCHVSQPSLSAQLAQLESVLGVRLFERDRRRVLPTAAGEALVARAKRVLVDADDLAAAAAQLGDPLAGPLHLGVIPTVSPYLLPDATSALRASCPRLSVRWTEEKTDVLLASLREGRLDGVLLARVAGLDDLECATVIEDPFVLATPHGHPLARGRRPARLADLEGETALLLEDGHCLRDQALALCTRFRVQEADFRATSLTTLVQMVLGGGGVTLLPAMSLPVENRGGALAVRRFAVPVPGRTIVLAWRRQSSRGPALQRVAAALRETARRTGDRRPLAG
jgi:LysR family hydrogen peroxide-inducible transcriptional activator